MRTKSKNLSVFLCLLLLLLTVGCSPKSTSISPDTAQEKPKESVVIKMGTRMPHNNVEGRAFQKFADLVKEKSQGQVIVNVYPAEQLGKGSTQIDNVLMGTQDIYAEGSPIFAEYEKRLDIASIPYLFRDFEQYKKFNKGEIGQDISKNLQEKGMRILNTERNFVRGPYRVLLSKKPIKTLDDVNGLKIRSFESELYAASWRHLGASPTVVAWTETYLALKQNVVDAVTSPFSSVYSMKFAEVAPHMTLIHEYPQDVILVMNEKKFQGLPKEYQDILISAANEVGDFATKWALEEVEFDLKRLKEENGLQVYEIDKGTWMEKMKPFYYQLEKEGKIPEGFVDKIHAIQ